MRGRVAFAVALILAFSIAPPVAADRDCADFSSQAQAQAYFEAGGGSSRYNFDRLDADHDGIACETLTIGSLRPTASLRPTSIPRTLAPNPTPTPSRAILTSTGEAISTGSSNGEG